MLLPARGERFVAVKEQWESEQWPGTVRGSFRLEGAPGNLYPNLLLKAGLARRSEEVPQSVVLSGLENLEGWRPRSLSGQPVAMRD